MSYKSKLIATVVAVCLVVTFGVFGILAVKTLNMSVGGNVSFDSYGINALISDGVLEGATLLNADKDSKLKGFEVTTNMSENQIKEQSGFKSWSGLNIEIGKTGTATLTFSVTNTSDNHMEIINIEPSVVSGNSSSLSITTSGIQQATTETANKTKTVTITFTVATTEINLLSTPFSISIKMSATENEILDVNSPSLPVSMTLRSQSAIVTRLESSSKNVAIPSYVKSQNKLYPVTSIEGEAFRDVQLDSLTIPGTIKSYGDEVFCYALINELIIEGEHEQMYQCSGRDFEYGMSTAYPKLTIRGVVKNLGNWPGNEIYIESQEMLDYLSKKPQTWQTKAYYIHKDFIANFSNDEMGKYKIGEYYYVYNIEQSQAEFEYSTNSDTMQATIVSYSGNSPVIIIPSQIIGSDSRVYDVTEIGGYEVFNRQQMIALIIPSTIKTIDDSALYKTIIKEIVIEGEHDEEIYNFTNDDILDADWGENVENSSRFRTLVIKGVYKKLTVDQYLKVKIESREMLEYMSQNPDTLANVFKIYIPKELAQYYTGTKFQRGQLVDGCYTYTTN